VPATNDVVPVLSCSPIAAGVVGCYVTERQSLFCFSSAGPVLQYADAASVSVGFFATCMLQVTTGTLVSWVVAAAANPWL
jgi:hypothetical protein